MINPPKVFVDSDVIISSLISRAGASFLLLSKKDQDFYISNLSEKELQVVVERLNIEKTTLTSTLQDTFKKVRLKGDLDAIGAEFSQYTKDPNDTHIVAGSVKAKARFLLTYNLRDYKIDKIKKDFGIIILTPASFLQYLRSRRE